MLSLSQLAARYTRAYNQAAAAFGQPQLVASQTVAEGLAEIAAGQPAALDFMVSQAIENAEMDVREVRAHAARIAARDSVGRQAQAAAIAAVPSPLVTAADYADRANAFNTAWDNAMAQATAHLDKLFGKGS